MGIKIGQKNGSSFADPLGLLSDCHRKIEHFFDLLILVTNQAQGQRLNQEQKEALEASLHYFREAGPKHKDDEEKSLFPRMRKGESSRIETAISALDLLEADHKRMDEGHLSIEGLSSKWLEFGKLSKEEIHQLSVILTDLQQIYQRHIALEDSHILPLAKIVLNPSEIEEIGREMMARRGIIKSGQI